MRKILSGIIAAVMLFACKMNITVTAFDGKYEITADKTAQWTAQEKASGYDLRIHGYKAWETAGYIGFSLPEDFTSENLVSASLKLYTKSADTAGRGYLYSADYAAFENGAQYEGADDNPAYNETQIKWIDELPSSGEGEIDITDYIKTIPQSTENLAFRIDGKSYGNTSFRWLIGSCTNDSPAPKLVLTYGESQYIKNNSFSKGTQDWITTGTVRADTDDYGSFLTLGGKASVSQRITGIECGKYDLHTRVKNDNMGNIAYVYAKAKGHPIMKTSVSVTTYINDGGWRDIYVRGINIDNGECEIGFVLDQLNADEIKNDPRVTNEPMPDGNGYVMIDSIELTGNSESNDNFLVGGDINWLTFLEEKGAQYFDENGTQKDAIQVMAENGANIVRLRLYNAPGKGHGDGADYLPAGYQNPEDILNLAKRAKEKGMQIQLTFHYSDYWSNAETQLIPHEWQEEIDKLGANATQDEKDARVEELLYEFTKDFMQKMKDQGTEPEYVSFGNEMHTGLLFSKGRKDYDYGSTYRQSRLASLLTTANRAAKEVSPDTKVILHLDGAGQKNKYNTFFNNCRDYNIPHDVIGISYYPYWYPTVDVDGLVDFCNYLVNTFDKDIMIMETGYSFVDKNLIGGQDNRFTDVGPYTDTFGMSKMGQKAFMEELYSGLKQTIGGRCLGDLYWDPIMIQHEGVGWAYKESDDSIEHNKNISITLFDTDGYKLPAQNVFKDNGYITDTVTFAGRVSGIDAGDSVTLTVNDAAYTILSDSFGDYVLRVPYADTLAVSASGAEEKYTIDMRAESVKRDIDFTVTGETADCISEIKANFDENGALSYKVSYRAIPENPTLYVAVYNSGGKLIACQMNRPQGSFNTLSSGDSYTIKAFLWDNEMKPLCDAKGQKAE